MKKLIALTMGDPGGIGPEIVLRTLKKRKNTVRFLVVGSGQALDLLKKKLGLTLSFKFVSSNAELQKSKAALLFWDIDLQAPGKIQIGKLSKANGAKALKAIDVADELARLKIVAAIVTAPLNKTAVRLVDSSFVGHTEFLAKKAGVKKYAMMFVGNKFLVALATIHLPLKKVAQAITRKLIVEKIELVSKFLENYQFARKDVAVCALNPHGRETGDEEDRVLAPAVREASKRGWKACGPYSADSLFFDAYNGKHGAVLAMYHDQALAPFKMISFRDGVNVTLGLPYLRTSPDHGTAFDIAYSGKADSASLQSALDLALRLLKQSARSLL